MMKAEADKAGATMILPGMGGGRQSQRARTGADQVLADFDRLLAKQSDPLETIVEAKSEVPPGETVIMPPAIVSDAALLAVAKLDQMGLGLTSAAPQVSAEAPDDDVENPAPVGVEDDDAEPEDTESQMPDNRPALSIMADAIVVPQGRTEFRAPEVAGNPSAPSAPAVVQKNQVRPSIVPANDAPPVIAAEQPQPTHETKPAVVVNVTAVQETHFAPVMPLRLDSPVSGPLAVDGMASPPPPVTQTLSHPAAGPLKTLKLQLETGELGPVNATVALKGDGLDLRIAAVREEAVAALRENAGRLTDALQSLGYSVDGVTVQRLSPPDAAPAPANSQPMQQGLAGQGGNSQAQWDWNGAQAGGSSRQSKQTPQGGEFAEHEGNGEAQGAGGTRAGGDVFV